MPCSYLCHFKDSGKTFGKFKIGKAAKRARTETNWNPIHQAPTHLGSDSSRLINLNKKSWLEQKLSHLLCKLLAGLEKIGMPSKRNTRCNKAKCWSENCKSVENAQVEWRQIWTHIFIDIWDANSEQRSCTNSVQKMSQTKEENVSKSAWLVFGWRTRLQSLRHPVGRCWTLILAVHIWIIALKMSYCYLNFNLNDLLCSSRYHLHCRSSCNYPQEDEE